MSKLVFDAITYAAQCHEGQYRKGTEIPYIVHPVSMLRFLARLGAPEELQAAAVLHDLLEDTDATFEDLQERFGPRVAELVQGASERDKSLSWMERKQQTIHHAQESTDVELLVLKCADKLDNLTDIRQDREMHGDLIWSRFNTGQASQMWYYGSLVRIFLQKLADTPYEPLAVEIHIVYEFVFGPLPE